MDHLPLFEDPSETRISRRAFLHFSEVIGNSPEYMSMYQKIHIESARCFSFSYNVNRCTIYEKSWSCFSCFQLKVWRKKKTETLLLFFLSCSNSLSGCSVCSCPFKRIAFFRSLCVDVEQGFPHSTQKSTHVDDPDKEKVHCSILPNRSTSLTAPYKDMLVICEPTLLK